MTKTVYTKTVLPENQEDVYVFPMLPTHLLQKMRHFGYLKEIKYIYVSMYVEPVKKLRPSDYR